MLDALIDAAVAGGAEILPIYAGLEPGEVRAKQDGSPVTLADERAEAVIVAALARVAPEIPVIAEEAVAAGHAPPTGPRFFLVDPLDGTREFVNGSGDFTVNIALIEDGRAVMGVVYAPATGAIYAGAAGQGARQARVVEGVVGAWRPLVLDEASDEAIAVIASRSHLSPETEAYIRRFPVRDFVSAGSSLKFCKVAAGEADLYPRLSRTMEWDTAAGDAILSAAGGRVCTLDGAALRYGKRDQADDSDFANPWFVATGRFDPFAERDREPD
ncbi:3'(2'),5'-bisphosphate nucleotidase CysQ [Sphingomonas sp. 1P06PA]|uniref:3'(2'),5'-bisphosphate nucleotidase CysQ n=1 Tax=Sphingomonas sp. 1P06PA TaxID=554121 RepID=UPI0039A751E3